VRAPERSLRGDRGIDPNFKRPARSRDREETVAASSAQKSSPCYRPCVNCRATVSCAQALRVISGEGLRLPLPPLAAGHGGRMGPPRFSFQDYVAASALSRLICRLCLLFTQSRCA
jgi:hypothetical protein